MEPDLVLRRLRRWRTAFSLVAVVLAGVALWLSVDNPTIEGTSRGSSPCLAPYDTVLNDAIDPVGGEPPPDEDEIAARCREAGEERFDQAGYAGAAAGVVALGAAWVGVLLYRRDRRVVG